LAADKLKSFASEAWWRIATPILVVVASAATQEYLDLPPNP
jgi:hypothetical protein